jgi:hypothetical protein
MGSKSPGESKVTLPSQDFSRTSRIWIALLLALALLSFLAMRRSLGKALRMNAGTTEDRSPAQLNAGDEDKVVLEVTGVAAAARVEGNVLERQSEIAYRRTGNAIKIAFEAGTPVVMGKMSDVHAGAVVHIKAKMGTDRVLRAEQFVILTGYVKVQGSVQEKGQ